jgi:hypothetical protein
MSTSANPLHFTSDNATNVDLGHPLAELGRHVLGRRRRSRGRLLMTMIGLATGLLLMPGVDAAALVLLMVSLLLLGSRSVLLMTLAGHPAAMTSAAVPAETASLLMALGVITQVVLVVLRLLLLAAGLTKARHDFESPFPFSLFRLLPKKLRDIQGVVGYVRPTGVQVGRLAKTVRYNRQKTTTIASTC